MKGKIKVSIEDIYSGLIEVSKKMDKNISNTVEIEGELVNEEDYKYKIGDVMYVKHYYDTHSYNWESNPRILGGRWGKIVATNSKSPKREEEGEIYFVRGKDDNGGWEKARNLELISFKN